MNHQTRVYDNIFEMLPSVENPSPLVRIGKMNPAPNFELYAKLEWMNPFGSVKDRAASAMIEDLESRGELKRGETRESGRGIVEPTSGNTGISLAAMASVKGYAMRAVVPQKVPLEKRVLLRIAGADVDVINDQMCPSPGMGEGSIGIARSYAKAQKDRYAMPNQYENELNVRAHVRTTGPEIWRQTGGRVTHVFVSLGTAGTAMGLSKFLKEKNPAVKVIAVQPSEGHDVPGLRNLSELHVTKLFDEKRIDEILEIPFELAYTRALELCRTEGLFAGPSSGLIYEGARRVLELDAKQKGVGVMVFCDSVFKYVSSMVKHIPGLGEE
ncbi:MAG: cysteine synthase family protein [Phycisphaeraceae bacterium]|nr:cysteine synthase family protein [Phycisphaeraceae bacterium]